jgi:hypothetical protein
MFGQVLADAVEIALPLWVRRCVIERVTATDGLEVAIVGASEKALEAVMGPLRTLLATDIDAQRGTPLTIIRTAVPYPTAVLATFGAQVPHRDPGDAGRFPDDIFALTPATWADIDESVADPGLRWSVAKAFEYKRRRRVT